MAAERHHQAAQGRDRVLTTARRLFIEKGAANVGINEIIAEAGIARMTLYNHFTSKEALIEVVYQDMAQERLQCLRVMGEAGPEEQKVISIFDYFNCDIGRENYRGCPLIHASAQTSSVKGPVHTIVKQYKSSLRDFIYSILDPQRHHRAELANQILLLLDGAVTEAYLGGIEHPIPSAKRAALLLLRASV